MLQSASDTVRALTTIAVASARSHSYITWSLLGLIALQLVAIIGLLVHRGWAWLSTVPTVNLRIINGIVMFDIANLTMFVAGIATGIYPPVEFVLAVNGALLLSMGLDVTQYGIKRQTTDPNVPSNQNVQAGITPGPPEGPPAPPVGPPPDVDPKVDPAPVAPLAPATAKPRPPVVPAQPVPVTNAKQAVATHRYVKGD